MTTLELERWACAIAPPAATAGAALATSWACWRATEAGSAAGRRPIVRGAAALWEGVRAVALRPRIAAAFLALALAALGALWLGEITLSRLADAVGPHRPDYHRACQP